MNNSNIILDTCGILKLREFAGFEELNKITEKSKFTIPIEVCDECKNKFIKESELKNVGEIVSVSDIKKIDFFVEITPLTFLNFFYEIGNLNWDELKNGNWKVEREKYLVRVYDKEQRILFKDNKVLSKADVSCLSELNSSNENVLITLDSEIIAVSRHLKGKCFSIIPILLRISKSDLPKFCSYLEKFFMATSIGKIQNMPSLRNKTLIEETTNFLNSELETLVLSSEKEEISNNIANLRAISIADLKDILNQLKKDNNIKGKHQYNNRIAEVIKNIKEGLIENGF